LKITCGPHGIKIDVKSGPAAACVNLVDAFTDFADKCLDTVTHKLPAVAKKAAELPQAGTDVVKHAQSEFDALGAFEKVTATGAAAMNVKQLTDTCKTIEGSIKKFTDDLKELEEAIKEIEKAMA